MPTRPIGEGDVASNRSEGDVEQQAARWVLLMTGRSEPDETDANEFLRWLREDPRHAAEYHIHLTIAQLGRDLPADVLTRIRPQVRHRTDAAHAFSFPRLGLAAGIVALALAFLYAGVSTYTRLRSPSHASYSTKTAETRSIHLDDGSVMELNSRTRVQWSVSPQDRRVDLLEGEVYIDVAHDIQRPFHVRVGESEIRVIGTRFDVYKKNADTVVLTLLKGTVQLAVYNRGSLVIWTQPLSAPRKIEYLLGSGAIRETDDSLADTLRWRDGVVQFRAKPLAEAVQELGRYTDRRVELDKRLANAQVGGLYSTKDVTGDFTRMAQFLPMTVHDDGKVIALGFNGEAPHAH